MSIIWNIIEKNKKNQNIVHENYTYNDIYNRICKLCKFVKNFQVDSQPKGRIVFGLFGNIRKLFSYIPVKKPKIDEFNLIKNLKFTVKNFLYTDKLNSFPLFFICQLSICFCKSSLKFINSLFLGANS